MIELLVIAGLYTLRLLLKMQWMTTVLFGLYMMVRVRIYRKRFRQMKEQQLRFEEACEYMDTFLYAFVKEGKVERALTDAHQVLGNGPMREAVEEGLDHLYMVYDDSQTDIMRNALGRIDRDYPCERIRTMHDFAVHVESYGGAIDTSVDLLLRDKSRWEKRIQITMKERQKMFMDVVLSIVVSLLICAMILYLPVGTVDIGTNMASQMITIVVLLLDDWIFARAQKYLMVDWLQLDGVRQETDRQKVERYDLYDEKKERKLSVVMAGICGMLTAFALYAGLQVWAAAGMFLTLFMANQHRIGRRLATKKRIKNIKSAFPVWLMDIVLLLQSENVQMALAKSQEHAPLVLEQELEILNDRLQIAPESPEPYHAFMQKFQIPEIHSAMSMLYALSMGNSDRADQQVGELITRNFSMQDAVETERLHNRNSGLYLLFLAPVVTASFKLLVDMALFMLTFLQSSGIGG